MILILSPIVLPADPCFDPPEKMYRVLGVPKKFRSIFTIKVSLENSIFQLFQSVISFFLSQIIFFVTKTLILEKVENLKFLKSLDFLAQLGEIIYF